MPALRNLAIIAHVDHGKTTLVDGMLSQAGTFGAHEAVMERVMDSMDLERERGITILSKNTAVTYKGIKINIVDTPGHADFGGEVERVLKMVDAALLLVDASEGPLPQTRFVLSKALEAGLEILVCINKIDRPDARIAEVVDEVYDLFIDLDADEEQLEFPIVYACAKEGTCSLDPEVPGKDLDPLFNVILEHVPEPPGDPEAVPRFLVTQLDYDAYVGRLTIGRLYDGTLRRKDELALVSEEGVKKVKVNQLYTFSGLERVEVEEVGPGDLAAIAGIDELNIGDSLTDFDDPKPLPRVRVDEPTIGMAIYANTSPYSGLDGKYVTARQIRERLEKELLTNVAMRLEDGGAAECMMLFGRGELQLAILVEQMRREGFEMSLGKPQVVIRTVDGERCEPWEQVLLDFPEEFMGPVTEKLAARKGQMQEMRPPSGGRARVLYRIPSRGLIGFRGEYLNDTRGLGILNTLFDGFHPVAGEILFRRNGSIVADRTGSTTAYALFNLQPRGKMFVGSGVDVYEGMIVGECNRENDINVDATRAKQLTNFRSSGADEKTVLAPPIQLTLEKAIEFIGEDEMVEVTPGYIRMRKIILDGSKRSVVRREKKKKDRG